MFAARRANRAIYEIAVCAYNVSADRIRFVAHTNTQAQAFTHAGLARVQKCDKACRGRASERRTNAFIMQTFSILAAAASVVVVVVVAAAATVIATQLASHTVTITWLVSVSFSLKKQQRKCFYARVASPP